MAVEMDEERAYRTFRKMVELLCVSRPSDKKEIEVVRTEPMLAPVILESESEAELETIPAIVEEPEKMISIGYGGFLYIKCPDCGNIRGFCAKARLSNFRCDCGSVTRLENLVPLFLRCECGRNARYLTNMEDPVFDIVCYDCGNPVPVAWNSKKKQYETIRG